MKKILFLLLSTIAGYGQVPADATPLENIQITNNVQDNTATKVTVQTSAGVQNWLPMVNLPVSTATQTAIDAKVGDFINDGATTIAPSMNAVYDALSLKQLVFTGIDQTQFLTENDIVFDNAALTLTIATVKNGTAISSGNPVVFYTDGNGVAVKHTKTAPVVFTFTNTTGVWHFYFDSSGNPIATQTAPSDSSTIARVYRIYWNSALAVDDKRVIESLEVYKNDATWVDRDWKDTQGAQYSSGFTISSNVLASGTPAIDGSNAVVNLTSGTIIDANLAYTLTNAATGTTKFTQNLGSGLLPATSGKFITITNNASLILDKIPATDFPFLWNATTNTPEYLTQLGVRTGVSANNFFVYYLYAIQDPRRGESIKIKSAEVDFANSSLAEAHTWTQLQTLFPTLRDSKIRVLYKLTFEYKTAFDIGTKKSALRKIEDLRKQRTTSTATVGGVIPASTVSFTPIGNISSSNVQLALEELDSEKQSLLGYTPENLANKAVANGYASLGADGKVPNSQIPALAISETFPVASEAAMLALAAAEQGDVAIRTDISKSFILRVSPPSVLTNWSELLSPTDAVTSVNGQVGVVNLTTSNISEGSNLYYTEARVNANSNVAANTSFRHSLVTLTVGSITSGLTIAGQTLNLDKASSTTPGALSSTDWNTFNDKAPLASPSFTGAATFASTVTAPTFIGALSGNAATATAFSNFSNGLSGGPFSGAPTSIVGIGGSSDMQRFNSSAVQSFLGLGSNAYTSTAFVAGTGTSGFIPKWTGTGTQENSAWQESATGGRLFDGTDDGVNKLQVNGSVKLSSTSSQLSLNTGDTATYGSLNIGHFINGAFIGTSQGTNSASDLLRLGVGGVEKMRIIGGNVLIGTATDDGVNKLQVNGSVSASSYTGNATLTGTPTAPTAAAGTNTTQIATTAFVQNVARPYKVYTALLTQTGTAAPTATVLENTLGGTVVWTRTTQGKYNGTLSGVFTANKVAVFHGNTTSNTVINGFSTTTDTVTLETYITTTGAASDDELSSTPVEIRVYN